MFVLGLLLFAQTGQDPPDDPNPEWPGQKAWCSNARDIPHKCQCARATECRHPGDGKGPITDDDLKGDEGMGSRCQTWCRKEKCYCGSPCTS